MSRSDDHGGPTSRRRGRSRLEASTTSTARQEEHRRKGKNRNHHNSKTKSTCAVSRPKHSYSDNDNSKVENNMDRRSRDNGEKKRKKIDMTATIVAKRGNSLHSSPSSSFSTSSKKQRLASSSTEQHRRSRSPKHSSNTVSDRSSADSKYNSASKSAARLHQQKRVIHSIDDGNHKYRDINININSSSSSSSSNNNNNRRHQRSNNGDDGMTLLIDSKMSTNIKTTTRSEDNNDGDDNNDDDSIHDYRSCQDYDDDDDDLIVVLNKKDVSNMSTDKSQRSGNTTCVTGKASNTINYKRGDRRNQMTKNSNATSSRETTGGSLDVAAREEEKGALGFHRNNKRKHTTSSSRKKKEKSPKASNNIVLLRSTRNERRNHNSEGRFLIDGDNNHYIDPVEYTDTNYNEDGQHRLPGKAVCFDVTQNENRMVLKEGITSIESVERRRKIDATVNTAMNITMMPGFLIVGRWTGVLVTPSIGNNTRTNDDNKCEQDRTIGATNRMHLRHESVVNDESCPADMPLKNSVCANNRLSDTTDYAHQWQQRSKIQRNIVVTMVRPSQQNRCKKILNCQGETKMLSSTDQKRSDQTPGGSLKTTANFNRIGSISFISTSTLSGEQYTDDINHCSHSHSHRFPSSSFGTLAGLRAVGGRENGKEKETGMVYFCNLPIDSEYYLLIGKDKNQTDNPIVAIDVVFDDGNDDNNGRNDVSLLHHDDSSHGDYPINSDRETCKKDNIGDYVCESQSHRSGGQNKADEDEDERDIEEQLTEEFQTDEPLIIRDPHLSCASTFLENEAIESDSNEEKSNDNTDELLVGKNTSSKVTNMVTMHDASLSSVSSTYDDNCGSDLEEEEEEKERPSSRSRERETSIQDFPPFISSLASSEDEDEDEDEDPKIFIDHFDSGESIGCRNPRTDKRLPPPTLNTKRNFTASTKKNLLKEFDSAASIGDRHWSRSRSYSRTRAPSSRRIGSYCKGGRHRGSNSGQKNTSINSSTTESRKKIRSDHEDTQKRHKTESKSQCADNQEKSRRVTFDRSQKDCIENQQNVTDDNDDSSSCWENAFDDLSIESIELEEKDRLRNDDDDDNNDDLDDRTYFISESSDEENEMISTTTKKASTEKLSKLAVSRFYRKDPRTHHQNKAYETIIVSNDAGKSDTTKSDGNKLQFTVSRLNRNGPLTHRLTEKASKDKQKLATVRRLYHRGPGTHSSSIRTIRCSLFAGAKLALLVLLLVLPCFQNVDENPFIYFRERKKNLPPPILFQNHLHHPIFTIVHPVL